MKFAFAAALIVVATQATELETEAEWKPTVGYLGSRYVRRAVIAHRPTYSYATHYNGCGHHTDSETDSLSDCLYGSDSDYSDHDHGYGYRSYHGLSRYYKYTPRYYGGRYYYGKKYASKAGTYYSGYKSSPVRSYRSTHNYKW